MHDQRPPVRWRPSIRKFAAAGVASFVVLTGFLGIRLAAGDDPALGDGQAQAQAKKEETPDVSVRSVVASLTDVIFSDDEGDDDDGESSRSNPSTGSSGG